LLPLHEPIISASGHIKKPKIPYRFYSAGSTLTIVFLGFSPKVNRGPDETVSLIAASPKVSYEVAGGVINESNDISLLLPLGIAIYFGAKVYLFYFTL
jgi:hypothetical protein